MDNIEKLRLEFYDYMNRRKDKEGVEIFSKWRKMRGAVVLLFLEKGIISELGKIMQSEIDIENELIKFVIQNSNRHID